MIKTSVQVAERRAFEQMMGLKVGVQRPSQIAGDGSIYEIDHENVPSGPPSAVTIIDQSSPAGAL